MGKVFCEKNDNNMFQKRNTESRILIWYISYFPKHGTVIWSTKYVRIRNILNRFLVVLVNCGHIGDVIIRKIYNLGIEWEMDNDTYSTCVFWLTLMMLN